MSLDFSKHPPPPPERHIAQVPKVVWQTQAYLDHGQLGRTPRVASRELPVTVWAPFTPIDYVRFLQRHARTQPPRSTGWGLLSAMFLVVGAVLLCIGYGDHQDIETAHSCQHVGLIVMIFAAGTGWLWIRQRDPNLASSIMVGYHQGLAYQDLRHMENPASAAYHFSQADKHQHDITERQAAEHQADYNDAAYWSWAETQPLDYQWQLADWFTTCLDTECTQRAGNRIQAEQSFVPTYDEVVAQLTAAPSAW